MKAQLDQKYVTIITLAIKIAIGSSSALYIASLLKLDYAVSAATITMLTILATKIETFKLSALRLLTFAGTVILACLSFRYIQNDVLAFGLFLLTLIIPSHLLRVPATIPVNAVIATHFLSTRNFSFEFIKNEFLLVFIGSFIASFLNLLTPNRSLKKKLLYNIRYTEQQLQKIFEELSAYLYRDSFSDEVWEQLMDLENKLHSFSKQAYEYQGNTIIHHDDYYVSYFDMRQKQCSILKGLRLELVNIRGKTTQACIVAEFIDHIKKHILEHNDPDKQLRILEGILQAMKKEELPKTRQEFEARAILYHILMDLNQFLLLKRQFYGRFDETIALKA